MKKIFGISLVAVLAVSPMMAMAETEAPSSNLTANSGEAGLAVNGTNVISAAAPYYAGKAITDTDRETAASAAYVKGAYNDAISAANAVYTNVMAQVGMVPTMINGKAEKSLSNIDATGAANISAKGTVDLTKNDYDTNTVGKAIVDVTNTATGAVQGVKVNSQALTEDANHDVNITITTGSTAGTISVNNTDVPVNGVLTQHQSLTDYAKKTGVQDTISRSTASGTFTIVTDWDSGDTDTVTVNSSITSASYGEPSGT